MSEKIDSVLMLLKGFTFDGDTGRTLKDLYAAVTGTGCTKDAPFVMSTRLEGYERPAAINSYLDPDGRRIHIVWNSDESGISTVVDIVLDAPSLAREESNEESCDICSVNMMEQLSQLHAETDD
ncbi:MAG TPA: hypothetical protein G4O07_09285 [Dehalococcoidia bacterium]|nr:hypothetical protein [Dehalococcoidia bacterium]